MCTIINGRKYSIYNTHLTLHGWWFTLFCFNIDILGCTPQLATYDGQVELSANKGWKSLIQSEFTQVQYLYLLFGSRSKRSPKLTRYHSSDQSIYNLIEIDLGFEYNIIHHSGTTCTIYYSYGGGFNNFAYR